MFTENVVRIVGVVEPVDHLFTRRRLNAVVSTLHGQTYEL